MNIFTLHFRSTGNVYIHPTANIDPTATVSIFPIRPLVLHHQYTQMHMLCTNRGKVTHVYFFLSQSSWVPTSLLAPEWLSVLESEFESPSSSMEQLCRWAPAQTDSWLPICIIKMYQDIPKNNSLMSLWRVFWTKSIIMTLTSLKWHIFLRPMLENSEHTNVQLFYCRTQNVWSCCITLVYRDNWTRIWLHQSVAHLWNHARRPISSKIWF